MAAHVYFASHGIWYPSHGFARVPGGVEVWLYTDFMKTLDHGAARRILSGVLTEPLRTVDAGSALPDFYLTPLGQHFITELQESWREGTREGYTEGRCVVGQSVTSATLVMRDCLRGGPLAPRTNDHVILHLICCQVVSLKPVGGKAHGVNASDTYGFTGLPGRYHIFERDATGAKRNERWVT